jgi:hypothetical protein
MRGRFRAPLSEAGSRTRPYLVVGLFPKFQGGDGGDSTMNLQKFEDGWKIVASHTSVAGM